VVVKGGAPPGWGGWERGEAGSRGAGAFGEREGAEINLGKHSDEAV